MDNGVLTRAVDQSLSMVEDQDETIEAQRKLRNLDPRIMRIKKRCRARDEISQADTEYRLQPNLNSVSLNIPQVIGIGRYSVIGLRSWLNGSISPRRDGQQ